MLTFTIITATYNAQKQLPQLLASLADQTYRDFELIIQDGASTDETMEIAESWRNRLPSCSFISHADTGIYDAWNKALARVDGEWVLFLGADDRLVSPHTLADVADAVSSLSPQHIFAAGDVCVIDAENKQLDYQKGLSNNVKTTLQQCKPAVHSALFTRAKVFTTQHFDTSFRICADHDFVLRCWNEDHLGVRIGIPVTKMAIGGMTSSIDNALLMRWELLRVINRHFGFFATLSHYKGIFKGLFLTGLVKFCGTRHAARIHNSIRKICGKKPSFYE